MRLLKNICGIIMACCLAACTADDDAFRLTPEQEALLGRAVNFDATIVEQFGTRTTYEENGTINEGDRMYIYRQYKVGNAFDESAGSKTYRVYQRDYHNPTSKWSVIAGKDGYEDGIEFPQTIADSLVWDKAQTVRFRSFSRSNYAGCITASRGAYYPDYCISDWISAAGPVLDVPLELKHLCGRIVIARRDDGTQLNKVEVCTEKADYMRVDNAGTNTDDNKETHIVDDQQQDITDADAQARADAVAAVYNRMCMPSGVDINNETLYAMGKKYYDDHSATLEDVEAEDKGIYDKGTEDGRKNAHIEFGYLTPAEIADNSTTAQVQRAVFNKLNGSCYFLTIPYDISNDTQKQGEALVLPPFTRFRVYLYDVNSGDKDTKPGDESEYHIFCLSDIKDNNGDPAYPNGLEMRPGKSYKFKVGYRYQNLVITDASDLSWDAQNIDDQTANKDEVAKPADEYAWWVQVMNAAADDAYNHGNSFNPVFNLDTKDKFLQFLKLVNDDARDKTAPELTHAYTGIYGGTAHDTQVEAWYKTNGGIVGLDTTWVRINRVNQESFDGSKYIFYDYYTPQDGSTHAKIEETYVNGPESFYHNLVRRSYEVNLTIEGNLLDLTDWYLDPIGKYEGYPFKGNFNGNMKVIKNANMNVDNRYLFGYIDGATIRNVYVNSTHNIALVGSAKGENHIVGISLNTNATAASIVNIITADTTYIVGCIHEGTAGAGLIGTINAAAEAKAAAYMYGCMEAGTILPDRTFAGGALCTTDEKGTLDPQPQVKDVKWGIFMCNYYDKTHNPNAHAVGSTDKNYRPSEYIRGYKSSVLKAIDDNKLPAKADYNSNYYGNAPYKAMNAAIYHYNNSFEDENDNRKCNAHYKVSDEYDNLYPRLVTGEPDDTFEIEIPLERS